MREGRTAHVTHRGPPITEEVVEYKPHPEAAFLYIISVPLDIATAPLALCPIFRYTGGFAK